ncbi:MAG: TlpA family protein disulfide reductase [Flavisolibacter sp.]
MKTVPLLAMSLFISAVFQDVGAQDRPTLKIGDVAPQIKYSKWLKGQPVGTFKSDQIYVLEFWATWCGPCRAAMPHLTKLQTAYAEKITIIGVDIWEDKKKGEPHDKFLPAVEKFIRQNNENMGYALFADNDEQYMGNSWMKAAGQEGIPSTFIVKDNKIIWIGDPMALDSILPKILNGSYDMTAYKRAFEKRFNDSQKLLETWLTATKPVQDAIAAKEYKRALDLIEVAKAEHPDLQYALNRLAFYTLLKQVGADEALAFGKKWLMQERNAALTILDIVSTTSNLPVSIYLWAAEAYEKVAEDSSPFTLHSMAITYAKGNDYKKAVNYEQEAIKAAEAALEKEKTGAMTVEILNGYKKSMANYKALMLRD